MENDVLTRQEQIVEYLTNNTDIVIPMRSGTGYYINKGRRIKLKSGEEIEVLDWLEREGLKNGVLVAGYELKHTSETEQFKEKLSFFKRDKETVLNVPFL